MSPRYEDKTSWNNPGLAYGALFRSVIRPPSVWMYQAYVGTENPSSLYTVCVCVCVPSHFRSTEDGVTYGHTISPCPCIVWWQEPNYQSHSKNDKYAMSTQSHPHADTMEKSVSVGYGGGGRCCASKVMECFDVNFQLSDDLLEKLPHPLSPYRKWGSNTCREPAGRKRNLSNVQSHGHFFFSSTGSSNPTKLATEVELWRKAAVKDTRSSAAASPRSGLSGICSVFKGDALVRRT